MPNPSALTIEEKLRFRAEVGVAAATLINNPRTAPIGNGLLLDLQAWEAQNPCEELKAGREAMRAQRKAQKEASEDRMKTEGPKLWEKWHRRALEVDRFEPSEHDWINREILAKLPCGECKKHFAMLMNDFAPDVFDGGYFGETVRIHNLVNEKLGKPTITPEDAFSLYS